MGNTIFNHIISLGDGESGKYDCIQCMNHPLVRSIICDRNNGKCRVIYKNGVELVCDIGFDFYNSQYGVGISNDGERVYIGHWEYNKGLCCYSIKENKLLWKLKTSKNSSIYVYDGYIVVAKADTSLLKINEYTGVIIDEVRSGTIDDAYYVKDNYLLVDKFKGKLTLFDTEHMQIVKQYREKDYNVHDCLTCVVREAIYSQGILSVEGFEEYPDRNRTNIGTSDFIRPIDLNVDRVIKEYEEALI